MTTIQRPYILSVYPAMWHNVTNMYFAVVLFVFLATFNSLSAIVWLTDLISFLRGEVYSVCEWVAGVYA